MPVDVLGFVVVKVWETVEGSDVAVLLSLSVLSEVVIVPGTHEEKTGVGLTVRQ